MTDTSEQSQANARAHADAGERRKSAASFHPRHVDLDFDAATTPKYWYRGDAYLTLLMNGLSLLFPEGERFFVETVLHYRGRIGDGRLKDEVAAFAGQEGQHRKEHIAFNEMLVAQGFANVPKLEREVRWILKTVRRVLSPKARLAATCALEHFTSILGEQILEHDMHRENMAEGTMRKLWTWHAFEESEHKAVAFDVYQAVGGGYVLRSWIMLLATGVFLAEVLNVHGRLLLADHGFAPVAWSRGLAYLWLKPGLFRKLIPAYLAYFRPGFHPSDRDRRALLAEWRTKLFGDLEPALG